MSNPYRGLPATNFWSQAVALAPLGGLDPVIATKFTITAADKVSTMGSCFAQHISRHLERTGLTYFVTEDAPAELTRAEADQRNFRVFSARFGNVYTVRQARQLFDRAFGSFEPADDVWGLDGSYVDAFRPQIEPQGFASIEQMRLSRSEHLAAVRSLFIDSDVVVFTLGLTESWESTIDGAIYPVAPGVHGGDFSSEHYRFVNFSAAEVTADLRHFVEQIRFANPAVRVLLTVSPVPLIATYAQRHVLVSNTVSKATLRVAAAAVTDEYDFVEYFPSYEIIAGSAFGAQYFEPDLRQVSALGVAHVMRIFAKHMIASGSGAVAALPAEHDWPLSALTAAVVCDEEAIEAALNAAGLTVPRP